MKQWYATLRSLRSLRWEWQEYNTGYPSPYYINHYLLYFLFKL